MAANTIGEVIDRLQGIIVESVSRGDRAGYFAALYNRVTCKVRDGIAAGRFEDGTRMEKLDVTFANRYLEAYDEFHQGQVPTRSWLEAFEGGSRGDLTVLQNLVLGMNAHINLDLGVAAARTCPGASLPSLQRDFNAINEVLASLLGTVESEMAALEPVIGFVGRCLRGVEGEVANRFIDEARDGAWKFATSLASLPLDEQASAIGRRDLEVAALGAGVIFSGPFARLVARGEGRDVAQNIRVLAKDEFTFTLLQAQG